MTRGEFFVELLDKLETKMALASKRNLPILSERLEEALVVVKAMYTTEELTDMDTLV